MQKQSRPISDLKWGINDSLQMAEVGFRLIAGRISKLGDAIASGGLA
jgi:hypothetical protein